MSTAARELVADSPLSTARREYEVALGAERSAAARVDRLAGELAVAKAAWDEAVLDVAAKLAVVNSLNEEFELPVVWGPEFAERIVIKDHDLQQEMNEQASEYDDEEPIRIRQVEDRGIMVNSEGWELTKKDCAVFNLMINNRGNPLTLRRILSTGLIGPQLAHDEARRDLFARVTRGLNRIAPRPLIHKQGQGLDAEYWLTPNLILELDDEASSASTAEDKADLSVGEASPQDFASNVLNFPEREGASENNSSEDVRENAAAKNAEGDSVAEPDPVQADAEESAVPKEPEPEPKPVARRPASKRLVAQPANHIQPPAPARKPKLTVPARPSSRPESRRTGDDGDLTFEEHEGVPVVSSGDFDESPRGIAWAVDACVAGILKLEEVPAPRTANERRQFRVALSSQPDKYATSTGKSKPDAPRGWDVRFRELQILANPALAEVLGK